jgi:serine/threonine-protein kinase
VIGAWFGVMVMHARRFLWCLAIVVLLPMGEACQAASTSPRAPGLTAAVAPLLAQSRRRARKTDDGFLGLPIWAWMVIGGTLVAVVGGALVLGSQKKEKASEGESEPDMVGRYRLLNLLMTGQTSQVWEAVHPSSGLHFAIKILLPEYAGVKEHREFLFHEAEVGMELSHPNVIRVVSVSKDLKHPHFVMDFFPGGSLKNRIQHKQQDFIKEKAHDILKQAATALAFMNAKGWVHRDIKPDNILVNSAGEVRLIDFAITQKITTKGMGRLIKGKGAVQGTRSYMSPEQIRNEPLDGRADIYSFGATCYELVTGRPPFRAANPQELLNKNLYEKPVSPRVHNPEVTEAFADLVMSMIEKKRESRPNNFHEILMALRKIKIFKADAPKKSSPT